MNMSSTLSNFIILFGHSYLPLPPAPTLLPRNYQSVFIFCCYSLICAIYNFIQKKSRSTVCTLFFSGTIISRLIHMAVYSLHSIAKQHSLVWIYCNLCICSSVGEHLGYFQYLALKNNTTINIWVQGLSRHMLSSLWGKYRGMECLGHMFSVCIMF